MDQKHFVFCKLSWQNIHVLLAHTHVPRSWRAPQAKVFYMIGGRETLSTQMQVCVRERRVLVCVYVCVSVCVCVCACMVA